MNKEKYNQIIEAVGQEYTKWFYDNAVPSVSGKPILNGEGILTRGELINKCKTDSDFAEKWGLKIEERELSLEERIRMYALKEGQTYEEFVTNWNTDEQWSEDLSDTTIPNKIIKITYNNKTIESYE